MVWLDGKPTLTKTLAWPADDPDLKKQSRERQDWSVLDDQILFWKAFPSSSELESPRTVVYMANTTTARDTQADTIILERVAELDYAAHRLAIVPDVGFVTAEWRSNSGVHFRAHNGAGELLRERHCPARASYGSLSVLGPTVSLCVTSTDPIPRIWENVYSEIHFCRLDFETRAGYTRRDSSTKFAGETIATWNAESGDLRTVKIPQTLPERIAHTANFQYISPDKIVLASKLAIDCGAVLCAFSEDAEVEKEPLNFYQGSDPDEISTRLGCRSTSTLGPIIVQNHGGSFRSTVFKSELLLGDIPSVATTRDPRGMRDVFKYPNDARTIDFGLPYYPCIAGTRVLVIGEDEAQETAVFVLDFDQTLLASLLSKQPSERADWNAQLVDDRAQVKVVTRRFFCCVQGAVGGAVDGYVFDQEYPWPQQTPPEWQAHLDTILKNDMGDSDVEMLPSGVEYDEAPEEHREPVPFGYVQTTLRLEGVTNPKKLAITPHAILELPTLDYRSTKNGRVFYFD